MKLNIIKHMMVAIMVLGLTSSWAMGQIIQTDTFSITNDGDENLQFNDFGGSLASLSAVNITLTVTGVSASGTFQGTSQNPTVPSATFTDTISLHNVNFPPANLTETDQYTGSAQLAQNQSVGFTANSFLPIPNTSSSSITPDLQNANLANFVGNGQFTLDVVTQMIKSNLIGANIPNSTYTVTGYVTVNFQAVPEPKSGVLAVICALAFIALYRGRRRNLLG